MTSELLAHIRSGEDHATCDNFYCRLRRFPVADDADEYLRELVAAGVLTERIAASVRETLTERTAAGYPVATGQTVRELLSEVGAS